MKSKIIIAAFAVLTVAGVYTLSRNMDMNANDAIAGTTVMGSHTISETCTGGSANTGFVPSDIAVALGTSTTLVGATPTYNPANATLTAAVDGQGALTNIDAYIYGEAGLTGISNGRALMNVEGPNLKVGGFQCTTVTQAGFKVKQADTAADADLQVTIDDYDLTDKAYDGANLDDSAADVMIFGTSGESGARISDATDRKGNEDGEFSFGGTGATSTGSYMYQLDIDETNRTGADTEALIITFEW